MSWAIGIAVELAGGAPMPAYPSEDYVRPILEPHQSRLAAIFDRAWERVSKNPDRPSFEYDRTLAVVMHQFAMQEVRAEFAGDRDVHLWEEHETIRVLINRRVNVRLKKMDENGYTRASPTQAALSFITPMAALPFSSPDDFPDQCSVDCGYVLNDLRTRIDHVLVAARNGDAVLWSYPIERDAPSIVPTLPIAPIAPTSPATIISVPDSAAARRKKT